MIALAAVSGRTANAGNGRHFPAPALKWSNILVMCLRQNWMFACLVLALGCLHTAGAEERPVVLGVLEDTSGHYDGDPHYRSVRVVFRKEGGDWRAFPHDCRDQKCLSSVTAQFPSAMNWTLAFDGRSIGQVRTTKPERFDFYGDVGQQKITGTESIPTIGKASQDFSGFQNGPVYRPLIAISKPHFSDPEQWKPAQLTPEVISLLRKQFRQKFPKVTNCANPEENVAKQWLYPDNAVKVIKAYSSKERWSVARLQLEEDRCDGPADDPFVDQWFSISPTEEVKFLDKAMWLVDAGDYDNDGQSELVFSIDDYNRGGYKLFYDHFKKEAVFEFGYH